MTTLNVYATRDQLDRALDSFGLREVRVRTRDLHWHEIDLDDRAVTLMQLRDQLEPFLHALDQMAEDLANELALRQRAESLAFARRQGWET